MRKKDIAERIMRTIKSPETGARALVFAVLLQAVANSKSTDQNLRLEAQHWLDTDYIALRARYGKA